MSACKDSRGVAALVFVSCLVATARSSYAQCGVGGDFSGRCVNLEWRPALQTVLVGETAEIGLYAVSVNQFNQPVMGIDTIVVWDGPAALALVDKVDNGPYSWMFSLFPDDRALDGLNADCGADVFCDPFTYMPFNDGDAFYSAASTPQPALATPEGLLVTTIRFEALNAATVEVAMPASCEEIFGAGSGCFASTRVVGPPGTGVITASVGPPAAVEVINCPSPTVEVEGSRYIAVTPVETGSLVAILVIGADPEVSCVSAYVQEASALGADPAYLPPGPTGWGTIHVHGDDLIGDATYTIMADCDSANPGTRFSDPVNVTTRRFGDASGDRVIDFIDITMIVDGFRNVWGTPVCCTVDADCSVLGPLSICNTTWEGCRTPIVTPGRCQSSFVNVDLKSGFGCHPDGVVDFIDITACVDAFRNVPSPCQTICP